MKTRRPFNLPSLLDVILIVLFGQIIFSMDMVPRKEAEVKKLNVVKAGLEHDVATLSADLASSTEYLQKVKNEIGTLTKEIEDGKKKLIETGKEIASNAKLLKRYQEEKARLDQENASNTAKAKELEEKNDEAERQLAETEKSLEKLDGKRKRVEGKIREFLGNGSKPEPGKKLEDLDIDKVMKKPDLPPNYKLAKQQEDKAIKNWNEVIKDGEKTRKAAIILQIVQDKMGTIDGYLDEGKLRIGNTEVTWDDPKRLEIEVENAAIKERLKENSIVFLKINPNVFSWEMDKTIDRLRATRAIIADVLEKECK